MNPIKRLFKCYPNDQDDRDGDEGNASHCYGPRFGLKEKTALILPLLIGVDKVSTLTEPFLLTTEDIARRSVQPPTMSRSSHRDRSQRKTLPVIGKKIGDLESYVKPIKGSSSLNAPIDSFSRPPSYESESWAVPVQTMTQSDSDDQQDSSESESSKVDFGTVHHSLAKEKVEPTDKSSAMETMEYKFQQTRRKRQQVKKSSRLTPIATVTPMAFIG
uniref:Uncharacterized protein n=1 Tax=Tetranychus urticae TaxID=32264 RepID=T1L6L4_TETUR